MQQSLIFCSAALNAATPATIRAMMMPPPMMPAFFIPRSTSELGLALRGQPTQDVGDGEADATTNADRTGALAIGTPVANRRDRHVEVLGKNLDCQ